MQDQDSAELFSSVNVETADPLAVERIVDLERYFFTTTMADSLRDTARLLLTKSRASKATVVRMAEQVNTLVDELGKCLDRRYVEHAEVYKLRMEPEVASIDEVLFASTQLARWIDSMLMSQGWQLGQQQARMQMHEVAGTIKFDDRGKVAGAHPTGTYL